MKTFATRYRGSLALLTDLYQLTMAYGYWKEGMADREAVFHLYFRKPPFGGGFAVACGLNEAIDFIQEFRFDEEDLAYLATLTGSGNRTLFDETFLEALRSMRLRVDVDAIPEGTVVFPQSPLLRVTGPLWQAQLLETPLLTLMNFATLVATKAARVREAASETTVLEFGLRRAQGPDGGITASRAAYVGGCDATSNVLAGKLFDIPVRGTHAHSWVMAFGNEQVAFDRYAEAMPQNSILLVDTYETLTGIDHAIETAIRMKDRGEKIIGIRLDSGDLLKLSRAAREKLDATGFTEAKIVASGDLDEYQISKLRAARAPIDIWGVGTNLVTAADQPSLGGVYKLSAIRGEDGRWTHRVKMSDDVEKSTVPGVQQVRRFFDGETPVADAIVDCDGENEAFDEVVSMRGERSRLPRHDRFDELLVPVIRRGSVVYDLPTIHEIQRTCRQQVAALPQGVRRIEKPERYTIGLTPGLAALRKELLRNVAAESRVSDGGETS